MREYTRGSSIISLPFMSVTVRLRTLTRDRQLAFSRVVSSIVSGHPVAPSDSNRRSWHKETLDPLSRRA